MTGLMPDVHADLMDCLQVNLAVLADEQHGPGTHLRLGAPLRLLRGVTATGLPTAEPGLDDHLADARDLLGLVPVRRWSEVPTSELRGLLRPNGATYVVADAYHLSWTPYARQRHMSHSFLVVPAGDGSGSGSPGYDVVDAYHNDTPWGRARPVRFRLDPGEPPVGSAPVVQDVIWFDPTALPPATPCVEGLTPGLVEAFLAPYRAADAGLEQLPALDRLVLESWLLNRSRRLHALHTGVPAADHLANWARVSEQLYIAMRRARRRAEVPEGVLDRFAAALLADIAVFGADPADRADHAGPADRTDPGAAGRTSDPRWPAFADFVATTLDTSAAALGGIGSLADVPTLSSLRIVEIVEGLESRFGARFAAEDLEPERLHDIDHLLAMIPRTVTP